ncbi:MAG TPA: VanW family protein [Candidatus Limnocylindria bacterium]|nr:VanW family protein [Candidatus Limnocylindria bacterium]
MTTATLPRRFIRPVSTAPARRSMLIGFVVTIAVGFVALAGAALVVGVTAGDGVMRGVSVAGIDLAGLDRAAARERLAERLPSLSTGEAVVSVDGAEFTVTYDELGRANDLDAMVAAAMAVGRDGNPFGAAIERLRSLIHPSRQPVLVHAYDDAALEAAARRVAIAASTYPVEATVTRDGTTLTVNASAEGRVVAAKDVAAALATAVDNTDPDDVGVPVSALAVKPTVDTAAATRAAATAESLVADLDLTIPGSDDEALTLDAATIAEWISFGPQGSDVYAARVDQTAAAGAIAALAEDVDQTPVNAKIAVAPGGGLGGVIAGQDGRELVVDESSSALLAALGDRASGASVPTMALAVNVTEPALTTAAAEAIRPQMQLVSSWTTYYVPGEGNGWGNNINIPARDIDGRNLAPGEWFSFWGGIGPVTVERGFMYGGVIINGRSVKGGAIGGGICSTSTTLFNAAMRAGLEIGERMNHYYYIDRYPDGLDATVYMDDNYVQDMTFRNDTENPIVIRGFGGNGFVTFQIWTVPTGRTVVLSDAATSNFRTAIETTQVSSAMAPGTSKRVEYPHDGHDVSRTRIVYAADGTVLHENHWFSSYRTVNGITLVGPTPAAPPPPADDDGETAGGTGDAPPASGG